MCPYQTVNTYQCSNFDCLSTFLDFFLKRWQRSCDKFEIQLLLHKHYFGNVQQSKPMWEALTRLRFCWLFFFHFTQTSPSTMYMFLGLHPPPSIFSFYWMDTTPNPSQQASHIISKLFLSLNSVNYFILFELDWTSSNAWSGSSNQVQLPSFDHVLYFAVFFSLTSFKNFNELK